jgi:hypothetical protein
MRLHVPAGVIDADSDLGGTAVLSGLARRAAVRCRAQGGDAFPTGSFQSTNYWVDPLFVNG